MLNLSNGNYTIAWVTINVFHYPFLFYLLRCVSLIRREFFFFFFEKEKAKFVFDASFFVELEDCPVEYV